MAALPRVTTPPTPHEGVRSPEPGWRRARVAPSLSEVYRTVPVTGAVWWRKILAFAGPGYLVAVGYMDPGNWATDLAGGSAFGYTLLSVALLSSLMAMLLQALCARVGIVTGRDLAQLCRDRFPRPVNAALWLLAEIAICATDLAELIGTAIALQLLFGLALPYGALVTAAGSMVVLLVWVYYSALIFFFGAEFTQAWATRHGGVTPQPHAVSGVAPQTKGEAAAEHTPRS